MAQQLINGKQQFIDGNGNPLAGGSVAFYAPGTLNPVNTWQDQGLTTLNTNPVILDANGMAAIWGADATLYREIVTTALGVQVWDQVVGLSIGVSAVQGGAYNSAHDTGAVNAYAMALSPPPAALTPGMAVTLQNIGATNTGAATLNVNGLGTLPILTNANPVQPGMLVGGQSATCMLNSAGSAWQLLAPPTLSVLAFGAVGDGVTDSTAAFAAAVAAIGASGATLYVPAGHYIVKSALASAGALRIHGDGASSVIDFSAASMPSSACIAVTGSLTALPALSANAVTGAYSITLASAPPPSIVPGSVVILSNPVTSSWSTFRPYYYQGEMLEVRSVSGNVLTFSTPIADTYPAATATLYLNSGGSVDLSGFKLLAGGALGGINVSNAKQPRFRNLQISAAGDHALSLSRCYEAELVTCSLFNVGSGGDDYGLIIGDSHSTRIIGGDYYSRRHGIAQGGDGSSVAPVITRNTTAIAVITKNDPSADVGSFDCHGDTENTVVIGSKLYGGAEFGGANVSYIGCLITSCSKGFAIYATEPVGGIYSLDGCIVKTWVDPTINGNSLIDIGFNNLAITADNTRPMTLDIKGGKIYGRDLAAGAVLVGANARSGTLPINVRVRDLEIDVDNAQYAVYLQSAAGVARFLEVEVDGLSYLQASASADVNAAPVSAGMLFRVESQAGQANVPIASGAASVGASITFKPFPVPPIMQYTAGSGIFGNLPVIALANTVATNGASFNAQSPTNVAWTGSGTCAVTWSATLRQF